MLYLKNGEKVEGKVVERNDDSVTVALQSGGRVPYWHDEIDHIEEDSAPVSDSQPLATSQPNAAPLYRKAASRLTSLPEDFQAKTTQIINSGWKDGDQAMRNLLTAHQEAIDEFKRASQVEHCQFTPNPPPIKDANSKLPQFTNEVKLVRLVLIEGRRWEQEHRLDLALEHYLAVLRFATHLGEQEHFVLLSKLMEIIVRKLAFTPIKDSLQRGEIDTQHGRYLLERLTELRQRVTGLEVAFEEENETRKNTLRMLEVEAKSKGRYNEAFFNRFYGEYETLQKEYHGYFVTAYRENRPKLYEEKIQQFAAEVKRETKPLNIAWESVKGIMGLPQGVNSPTLVAKILFFTGSAYTKVVTRYYASLAEFDVLIAAAAVKLYELEHGQAPENLQALVPVYLTEVPHDPFDEFRPLKYLKRPEKGWVVYSLGPDRQDNQGLKEYDEQSSPSGDIVVTSS